jgi:acyl-CoA dehydrogenase
VNPVSLTLTREQGDLREAVAELMGKRSAEAEVRRLMAGDTGYDPAVWRELASMGLLGIVIPEHLGGSGRARWSWRWSPSSSAGRCCARPTCRPRCWRRISWLASGDDAEQTEALPRIAEGALIAGGVRRTGIRAPARSRRPSRPRPVTDGG